MYELHEAAAELLGQLEQGWVQRDDGVAIALRQALARYGQEPVNKMPTKIFGPSLEQILNAAGFYKREWVGLADDEVFEFLSDGVDSREDINNIEKLLKEKNEHQSTSI